MELTTKNEKPLEFLWKDVTFYVRPTATASDAFYLAMAGSFDTKILTTSFNYSAYYRKVVELFVSGWKGVTQDGKEVPYSFEALCRLPADPGNDLFMLLGSFIVTSTGLIKQEGSELKNG